MLEPVRLPDPKDVPGRLHVRHVGRFVGGVGDFEDHVDDGFGREPRDGRRSRVLEEADPIAKDPPDADVLAGKEPWPLRVVVHELDRPVEDDQIADRGCPHLRFAGRRTLGLRGVGHRGLQGGPGEGKW